MKDLISVIVPVYNMETYIKRCVDSIINQTFFYMIEIILVDDGSIDNSGDLCDIYAQQNDNIRVIHKQNGGLSDARNKGIDESKGNFLAFIDSDDFVDKYYLETLYCNLKKCNADISVINYKRFQEENELSSEQNTKEIISMYSAEKAVEVMLYTPENIPQAAPCKLYKKSLFSNIRYPLGRLNEDIGTTYQLFLKAKYIVVSNLKYYYYYQRRGSIVHSAFNERSMDAIFFSEEILNTVERCYPSIRKAAVCFALSQNIQILVKLPYKDKRYSKYTKYIKQNIRKYRKTVILDSKVTWQRRLGAMSTYAGLWISQKLGQLYKKKVNHENVV